MTRQTFSTIVLALSLTLALGVSSKGRDKQDDETVRVFIFAGQSNMVGSDSKVKDIKRFPPFAGARRIDSYAALYDVTHDWYPYIGPRSGLRGYFDACGGSGHGFKIGAAIGRHLARWISTNEVEEDFARLSYDRIANNEPFVGAYGGNRA